MAKIAPDNWLSVIRFGRSKIPIRASALESFITRLVHVQCERFKLELIPVVLFSEPPEDMKWSYGWFTSDRRGNPIAICFNLTVFGGLTCAELRENVYHEFAHYLACSRGFWGEPNGGHGVGFRQACMELGINSTSGSSHHQLYVENHLLEEQKFTEAKSLFLAGKLDEALSVAREESLYGRENYARNICFEAFLEFFIANTTNLMVSLDDLQECIEIEDDLRSEGIWAYLWLQICGEEEQWQYLMHLKNAARKDVLAKYFWGKILIQGAYGLSPAVEKGMEYIKSAMRSHFEPAMELYVQTMQKLDPNYPGLEEIVRLIRLDIGVEVETELIPGRKCDHFIPYL